MKFIAVLLSVLGIVSAGIGPCFAQAPQPPIIDAHFHARGWMEFPDLIKRMDALNVLMVGGAYPSHIKNSARELADLQRSFKKALGDRFIYTTNLPMQGQTPGGFKTVNEGGTPEFQALIDALDADLSDGAQMMGEVFVNTASWAPSFVRRKLAANGPLMQALWTLAAKHDVPLMAHLELDDDTTLQLEDIMSKREPITFILAHCGSFTGPNPIGRLMSKFPNLNCDLANRDATRAPNNQRGPERTIYSTSWLVPGWKALIEAFPDRFSVGSDPHDSWGEYEQAIKAVRSGLLANLTPETARKVAYQNAARWLKIDLPPS